MLCTNKKKKQTKKNNTLRCNRKNSLGSLIGNSRILYAVRTVTNEAQLIFFNGSRRIGTLIALVMRRDNPGELIQIQLVRAAGGERYRLFFIERQIFGNVGRSFNFRVSQGRAEVRCLVKRSLRRKAASKSVYKCEKERKKERTKLRTKMRKQSQSLKFLPERLSLRNERELLIIE